MKHSMLRGMTTASVLALCVVGAQAADLLVAPVVEAPAAFNWTGFYIGVHGGIGGGDFDTSFVNDAGDYAIDWSNNAFGGFGGVQVGYNYQFAPNWVAGVEADLAASGISASHDERQGSFNYGLETKIDWFGTLRGRIGYAWDNVLVYGTGGAAYGDIKAKAYKSDEPDNGFEVSDTQWGWTAGAGVEYGITPNVTLKAEYLYVDLGSIDFDGYNVLPELNGHTSADAAFHTLKAGLNYKF
jgi:outer membrane immunogenic protein